MLDESALWQSMGSLTADLSSVLHVPRHLASMLLRMQNWNREKVESAYFEDPDRCLESMGLQHMAEDGKEGFSRASPTPNGSPEASTTSSGERLSHVSQASTSVTSHSSGEESHSHASSSFNCPVCYDDFPLSQTLALGCGHRSVAQ